MTGTALQLLVQVNNDDNRQQAAADPRPFFYYPVLNTQQQQRILAFLMFKVFQTFTSQPIKNYTYNNYF